MQTLITSQSQSDVSLTVRGLAAGYGARLVIRDLHFSLRRGEVLVISGANGSGKSTLVRLLCGLQRPLEGQVIYEYAGNRCDPRDARHLFGWVAPDLALYRELSAAENLRFFARVRNLPLDDVAIAQLLADVGLRGRGADLVAAYSSGMQQRLRYAYALLHQPPVLLLDEPTVTLDQRGVAVVDAIIERRRRHGIVVIATNDPREIDYGDYVLTLGGAA